MLCIVNNVLQWELWLAEASFLSRLNFFLFRIVV